MTIEKELKGVFLKLIQDWLEIVLQAKRKVISDEARNVATMLTVEQAVKASLELIKPMSRERLYQIFAKTKGCKESLEDCSFKKCRGWAECERLANAILKEWEAL